MHIIDYILGATDPRKQNSSWKVQKKEYPYARRKIKLDDVIFYCKKCEHLWSEVSYWVDTRGWSKYPKNIIPTIGKRRKRCPICKKS